MKRPYPCAPYYTRATGQVVTTIATSASPQTTETLRRAGPLAAAPNSSTASTRPHKASVHPDAPSCTVGFPDTPARTAGAAALVAAFAFALRVSFGAIGEMGRADGVPDAGNRRTGRL